ncbi:MAG: hypothetical protein ACKVP7_02885 [Hyphomicrobiaceae bacterium]
MSRAPPEVDHDDPGRHGHASQTVLQQPLDPNLVRQRDGAKINLAIK